MAPKKSTTKKAPPSKTLERVEPVVPFKRTATLDRSRTPTLRTFYGGYRSDFHSAVFAAMTDNIDSATQALDALTNGGDLSGLKEHYSTASRVEQIEEADAANLLNMLKRDDPTPAPDGAGDDDDDRGENSARTFVDRLGLKNPTIHEIYAEATKQCWDAVREGVNDHWVEIVYELSAENIRPGEANDELFSSDNSVDSDDAAEINDFIAADDEELVEYDSDGNPLSGEEDTKNNTEQPNSNDDDDDSEALLPKKRATRSNHTRSNPWQQAVLEDSEQEFSSGSGDDNEYHGGSDSSDDDSVDERKKKKSAKKPAPEFGTKRTYGNYEPPMSDRQQLDSKVRQRIRGMDMQLWKIQQMSTPVVRSDDAEAIAALPPGIKAMQAAYPHVVIGMFCLTEQRPNGDGKNKKATWLDHPEMHFWTPSKYSSEVVQDYIKPKKEGGQAKCKLVMSESGGAFVSNLEDPETKLKDKSRPSAGSKRTRKKNEREAKKAKASKSSRKAARKFIHG